MPYRRVGSCVEKQTSAGWITEKCHESVEKAQAHLDALNINVMSEEEKSGLFARFLNWVKAQTQPDTDIGNTGFKVQGNRWFAWWSNNFEDRDGEIFTEAAIDNYVGRVKSGETPYPELWFWHIPGTKHGQADYVGRIGHFAVAAGTFENTPFADAMKAYYSSGEWAVSHGFRYLPSRKQRGVYHHFTSFELSPLRPQAASNPYTRFDEVVNMQISAEAMAELEKAIGKEQAASILQQAETRGKQLEQDTRYKSTAETVDETAAQDLADVKAQLADLQKARQSEAEAAEAAKAQDARFAALEKTQNDIAAALKQLTQLVAEEFEVQPPASKHVSTLVNGENGQVQRMMDAANKAGQRKISVLEKAMGYNKADDEEEGMDSENMPGMRRGGKS